MLLGPDEIALCIQHRHSPGWAVWYGRETRQYWALASWVPGRDGFIGAPAPEALDAVIITTELLHPKPARLRAHAVSDPPTSPRGLDGSPEHATGRSGSEHYDNRRRR